MISRDITTAPLARITFLCLMMFLSSLGLGRQALAETCDDECEAALDPGGDLFNEACERCDCVWEYLYCTYKSYYTIKCTILCHPGDDGEEEVELELGSGN